MSIMICGDRTGPLYWDDWSRPCYLETPEDNPMDDDEYPSDLEDEMDSDPDDDGDDDD